MITRRHFNALLGATGISLVTAPYADGQSIRVFRSGNATGLIDPQASFQTIGNNPRLGFYEEEGVRLEMINMAGAAQTLQGVATGAVEKSAISPTAFLNVYAKNPDIGITFPYCWLRQPHWSIAVKPDSPIQSVEELKGMRVGIRNQGDTGYFGARAMFAEFGIDPDSGVEWIAVGDGGPAGEALHRDRIDAMAFWDAGFARIEIAGFPLRHLPLTEGMKQLFGNAFGVQRSEMEKDPDLYGRFFRGLAKSTVFAYNNIDLAIELHWEIYPESIPKGLSREEAHRDARRILDARYEKWMPGSWQDDQRMGAMTQQEWEAQVGFAGLEDQISDVTPIFTRDLLDQINDFDAEAIADQAKSMKI